MRENKLRVEVTPTAESSRSSVAAGGAHSINRDGRLRFLRPSGGRSPLY